MKMYFVIHCMMTNKKCVRWRCWFFPMKFHIQLMFHAASMVLCNGHRIVHPLVLRACHNQEIESKYDDEYFINPFILMFHWLFHTFISYSYLHALYSWTIIQQLFDLLISNLEHITPLVDDWNILILRWASWISMSLKSKRLLVISRHFLQIC